MLVVHDKYRIVDYMLASLMMATLFGFIPLFLFALSLYFAKESMVMYVLIADVVAYYLYVLAITYILGNASIEGEENERE